MKARVLSILFILLIYSTPLFSIEERVAGVVHLHSVYSSGSYTVEELVNLAEERGLQVLIITDHYLVRVEYGLFPFRNLFKVVRERDSILSKGVSKYLEEIESVNRLHPEMIVIAGMEVAPFYYWSGSWLQGNLQLNNWNRHMLILGLGQPKQLLGLPLLGGKGNSGYSIVSLIKCYPLLLIYGAWRIIRYGRGRRREKQYKLVGLGIILLSSVSIVNNFPFQDKAFNPYDGDQGVKPYQRVIDYSNQQGGLVFWAHPETKQVQEMDGVSLSTDPYPGLLLETNSYHGFASLYEGWRQCASPGGYWDQCLTDYCSGKRIKPVWTIGEADYGREGESGGKRIEEVQTVFLTNELNRNEILECLRKGRVYSMRRTLQYELRLEEFSITVGEKKVSSGEFLSTAEGSPTIHFAVSTNPSVDKKIEAKLIRNGEVIKVVESFTNMRVEYTDEISPGQGMVYYRLDVSTEYPHRLFSNPIFIDYGRGDR